MTNLKLIMSLDKNGIIGYENKLPWKLSDDLKNFKAETEGSPIIMGRNTWNSLPGILPNREHIILSSTLKESNDKYSVFNNFKLLIEYLRENYKVAYVIGGANIANQFIKWKMIDELILTHVNAEVVGDTSLNLNFIESDNWEIYSEKEYKANAKNDHDFKISRYIKRKKRFY